MQAAGVIKTVAAPKFQDMRAVSLTIRYSFGSYKEKKVKTVDTSRFGT